MKPLFTETELNNAISSDELLCECYQCHKPFQLTKLEIQRALNPNNKTKAKYCSNKCGFNAKKTKITVKCINCDKNFQKLPSEIKRSPNHFCSHSCRATYRNTHKITGTKRSRLESWLEVELTQLYPKLDIHFNRKDTIGSELDIYIPSLRLAFEINGIFHYKPIFGETKFKQIKNNDTLKSKACINNNIILYIINISTLTGFKPSKAQQYLDIITTNISKNLVVSPVVETRPSVFQTDELPSFADTKYK